MKISLKAEIEINGVNPYVLVRKELAEKLQKGWKRPMPVIIQVNGKPNPPWKINMVPIGNGNFYLYLAGVVRKASNTKVGDIVDVEIEFDTSYHNGPLHPMPDWLEKKLNSNSPAKDNWNSLTPSRQKEILRYLVNLKSEDAKERNLERVMHVLSGGKARYMGRSWNNGK